MITAHAFYKSASYLCVFQQSNHPFTGSPHHPAGLTPRRTLGMTSCGGWAAQSSDRKTVRTKGFKKNNLISSKNHPKSSKIYIVTFASPKGFPGCFFLHHYIFRILFEHNQGRHLIISRSRRAVDLLERVAASATILLSLSGLILIKIQMFIPNINGTEESHLLFSWVPAATSMKVFGAHKSSNWNAVLALTRKNANRTNI